MTDAQTDREVFTVEEVKRMILHDKGRAAYSIPGVADGYEQGLMRGQQLAAAKQHLDTTKPDDGGLREAAERYIRAEQHLKVVNGDPNQQDKRARASDERARAVSELWGAIHGYDLAATTPSPNEAEIRADERRRIDELAAEGIVYMFRGTKAEFLEHTSVDARMEGYPDGTYSIDIKRAAAQNNPEDSA